MHSVFQEDTDTEVRASPAIPIALAIRPLSILKYSEPGYWATEQADLLYLSSISSTLWLSPLVQFVVR